MELFIGPEMYQYLFIRMESTFIQYLSDEGQEGGGGILDQYNGQTDTIIVTILDKLDKRLNSKQIKKITKSIWCLVTLGDNPTQNKLIKIFVIST